MSNQITTNASSTHRTTDVATAPQIATAASTQTRRLLSAGIVAGPLFFAVWALQALTRAGFDPSRHPISLLSVGELGWVQIANFVVTGSLYLASAVGVRRVLHPGRGGTWGPRLIGAVGAGLIVSGVFVTDAGAGFPVGAPAGAPTMSWHGALHEVGFIVVGLSWTAACFVLRRRFAAVGERRLGRLCVAAVIAVFAISAVPDPDSFAIRIVVATALQFGMIAILAARLRRGIAADPKVLAADRLK